MADGDFATTTLEIARETMKGQLRDLVLDHLIHGRKNTLPWNMWPESEQQALIEQVEQSVGQAVRRAVQILAADGKQAILANIESMTVKDGLKIVAKASRTEANLIALGDQVGDAVLIVIAEDAPYQGGQERKPDPLQQNLGLDDGEEGSVFDNTPSGDGDKPKGGKKK